MDESDYYYRDIIEGASDADSVDSSDDDTDYRRLFDHGKHLSRADLEVLRAATDSARGSGGRLRRMAGNDDDDEDSRLSFEREMENEARNHVNGVHVSAPLLSVRGRQVQQQQPFSSQLPASASASSSTATSTAIALASTSKTREQENDELLYDPDEDDRDQQWADAHRAMHSVPPPPPPPPGAAQASSSTSQDQKVTTTQPSKSSASGLKANTSDATLNCPCCLTLLCLDCQRHQLYRTQYRAMFVLNCRVDYGRKLLHRDKEQRREPFKRSKKKKKNQKLSQQQQQSKKLKTDDDQEEGEEVDEKEEKEPGKSLVENQEEQSGSPATADASASDLYHPVHCTACNTQVALYDTNEVYHFFSVIASH